MNEIQNKKFIVNKIVFYNKDSKWGVLGTSANDDLGVLRDDLMNDFGSIGMSGNFEGVYEGCEVEVTGDVITNPKYGKQIQIKTLKVIQDTKSKEGVINFLSRSIIKGISIQNATKIYKAWGDKSIDTVLNNPQVLIHINGIGKKTISKIMSSVDHYKRIQPLVDFCSNLGLNYTLIMKLDNELGDKALSIIKEDPFKILEVAPNLTFKQVDEIFLKAGGDPKSKRRLEMGFLHTLKNLAMLEGSTGCKSSNLKTRFCKLLNLPETENFYEQTGTRLENADKIVASEGALAGYEAGVVYYKEYLNIEKSIAEKIALLNMFGVSGRASIKPEVVEEELKNFPFTLNEQQVQAVRTSLKTHVSVLTGSAGCVDCDTEYFNGKSWVRISEYKTGDKVLQYNSDGTAEMVSPLEYIKFPSEELTLMKNYSGSVNQVLSDEHRVVYLSSKGNLNEEPFGVIKNLVSRDTGFDAYLIPSFKVTQEIPVDLTEDRLRLLIAISADGSLHPSGNFWRVRLKKQHKIDRLKGILKNIGLEIQENIYADGYSNFIIPFEYGCKEFPASFYFLPENLKKVFCEEILYWDGSTKSGGRDVKRYFTTIKSNADLVQFLWTQDGTRVSLLVDDRVGQKHKDNKYTYKSPSFTVCKTKTRKVSLSRDLRRPYGMIHPYKTKDGFKYCFRVPSGMLVLRRANNIFITGNSGKSSITKALYRIYTRSGFNTVLLSPTAKACRRLEECTGGVAQTVHKFLGMNKDGERTTYEKFAETVIIVDEASMLDIILFNYLLESADPTTRIILVGDNNQLPSVQAGNVLGDLISSGKVTTSILTDVMRQGSDSNIIRYCNMTNNGEIFDPCEEQDFHYEEFGEGEELRYFFIPKYLEEVKKYGLNEVQVIAPYKKGELGMDNLNVILQDAYNKNGKEVIKPFREGDRVRHTQNDYQKEVFNGETGIVLAKKTNKDFLEDDDEDLMEVDYGNKIISYEPSEMDTLTLSYCSTVHASQGSEYSVVFVILDDTAVNDFLLIRRLLYTALSRGKKKVYVLTKPYLVDKCISNNSYRSRITKLCDYLRTVDVSSYT